MAFMFLCFVFLICLCVFDVHICYVPYFSREQFFCVVFFVGRVSFWGGGECQY